MKRRMYETLLEGVPMLKTLDVSSIYNIYMTWDSVNCKSSPCIR